jgi:hypothetical protein
LGKTVHRKNSSGTARPHAADVNATSPWTSTAKTECRNGVKPLPGTSLQRPGTDGPHAACRSLDDTATVFPSPSPDRRHMRRM